MILSIIIFTLGLMVGSFLNVVIYRLPEDDSIIFPASHCPGCNTTLKYYELIPVFSFIYLKGKCRYCGMKISWQYPVVELMTGLLFLALYLKFGFSTKFMMLLLIVSLLIASSVIDLRHKIIPNKITYSGIVAGLVFSLLFNHISFLSSLLGAIIPAGLLLLIALIYKKGMGLGDVKLVAMIGSFIGYKYTLLGIFFGSLIGSIIGLTLMGTGMIDRKTRIPFGPLISLGTIIMILYGNKIIDFYLSFFM